ITLKKSSDNSTVESIDVTSSLVTGTGTTTITINPTTTLDSSTTYYLNIDATAFDDSSGNSYVGISDATTLNFTSADVDAPTLSSSTPSDDATGVAVDTNIVLTFDESVNVESGNITLKKSSDNSTVESIDVTSSLVTGTGTTTITINPTTTLDSLTTYYLNIDATAFDDSSGNSYAGITNTTTLDFTSADVDAPTIVFAPVDSADNVTITSNITLTFNEAIRNTDDSALTDANISSLITLKNENLSGSDIPFSSTIDTSKKVITIHPTSDFSSEQMIYVGIGPTVEDTSNNAITATSITFRSADITPPNVVFDPIDSADNIPITSNITLTFNEAIRNTDNSPLSDSNIDNLITLKDSDLNGDNINFNATIDTTKKVITINPISSFSSEQEIYAAIGATVEDVSNNAIAPSSITFTAADSTPPNLEFTPVNSATGVAVNSDITISFDEVIRNLDDSSLTDSNVDSLITLKTNNSSGSEIAFDAFIDTAKQLITISPISDFSSEQIIYVAIDAKVEDVSNNAIAPSSITFTAADSTAPTVAFVPPDTSSCVPVSSNVSLTFSEGVRNLDASSITGTSASELITLEYTADNSPIPFTTTIDTDKKIISVIPNTDLISGEVISITIEAVEDFSGNTMSATSGTFCVVDSNPPVITFSPANLSTLVAADTDIILSFDEEIRLKDNSTINNTNVDGLITVKNTNESGSDIAFNASIDSDKRIITIDLVTDLSSNQTVYVSIGATVEDTYNNLITADSVTFTSGDTLPPTVDIEAVIVASIATNSDITFTFSEAVRNLNNSLLTDSNVGSLITLKDSGDTGFDIPFTATINTTKTIITIDPISDFTSQQVVYAAIGDTVEDYADNALPATSKTFTAEYLKTELQNPLNEKDVIGLIEAQLDTTNRFAQHSTNSVLKRVEWLRIHRNDKELSRQGITLKFINSTMAEIADIAQLSKSINKSSNLFNNDWAVWSDGNITIGEIEETSTASIRGIRSSGITIGMDKIINKNQMFGAALRIEDDKNDIGTTGTKLNTDGYSLSFYGTNQINDNTFIASTLGIGLLRVKSTRIHQSGILSGIREGDQIFGSILFGTETPLYNNGKVNNQATLTLYGRLDGGYTTLQNYSEFGTVAALIYNEQNLRTAKGSIGMKADDKIKLNELTFMPRARIEYGWDFSNSSDAIISYNTYPNTNYTFAIDPSRNANLRLGLGADIELGKDLFFTMDYQRTGTYKSDETKRYDHENTLSMGLSFQPNPSTDYFLSLSRANSALNQVDLDFYKNLNENWSLNLGLGLTGSLDSGYKNIAKFNTVLSF
ncbi:MAG: Ig-like domain-containing protein, partial [Paracoccaceae bacterium]